MVTTRLAFQTAMRAAAVQLLTDYAASVPSLGLQVYRTLPTTIRPPTAFVERMDETTSIPGITQRQRSVRCSVIVLFRISAAGERGSGVDQRDAFVDGFADWVLENFHQPGPTELIAGIRTEDAPYYVVPGPRGEQISYEGVRIVLEGYTAN